MKRSLMLLMLVCSFRLLGGCGGGTSTQRMQLQLQGAILPPATAQTPYNTALSLSGGVGPYTWTWAASPSSSLPPGLILGNGDISGTPTTANSYSLIVTVKDSQSPPAQSTAVFTIVVIPLTALTIASGAPPNGTIATAYDSRSGFLLTASGGVAPYTWSWAAAVNSSLPPGLSLTNGSINGTPTTLGTYNVVVTLTDSGSPAAQKVQPYTIMIDNPRPPIISTSPAPPAGALNTAYAGFTFTASGGLAPLTWGETGALPGGMTLGSDGKLSGTPTATGSFTITVTVEDSLSQNASPQNFTIQVDARAAGFTATGSMGTGRAYHTATLLASGEVLVAGGEGAVSTLSAELYDPSKKAFTPTTGNMVTPRTLHTATLLCDLTTPPCKNQKVLVAGGLLDLNANITATAEAELYDPATGQFTATGKMGSPRSGHTATLLNDGTVLVSGGGVATAEIYNPNTESFTPVIKPMIDNPRFHTATLLTNGNVLIAGGGDTGELFDPISNTFTPTADMGTSASFLTATLLQDGRVLLAGGRVVRQYIPPDCKPCYGSLSSAQLFETSSASFSATGGMYSARDSHTASLLPDGKVLIAGGALETVERFQQIVKTLASAELFDSVSGSFALTGAMITARRSHTATLLSDGTVLVIGGLDTQNNYLATAELYQ